MDKLRNNVTRLLTQKKISHELLPLDTDEKQSALEVAEYLQVSPQQVYKTIVVMPAIPNKKPILALIPAGKIVDVKAVAMVCAEKKVNIPTQTEAEKITGLQSGGISPLALINKGFKVLIDASAESVSEMIISAGQRGYQIKIHPHDLQQCTNAIFHLISKDMD